MFRCEICNKEFKVIRGLSNHLSKCHKEISKEEYYKKYLIKDTNENICKMYGKINSCKKYTNFISIIKGYVKYCSNKCMSNDPEIKEKTKQTNLKKYGVEYLMQSNEIHEKSKQTCLKNYGVKYAPQSKEIQEKMKQTNLKNHGVEYTFQSLIIREKSKQTNLKNHGVQHPAQSKKIQEKMKQTNLKNHGVKYALQSKEIQKKFKQTCLKNYGVENPSSSKELQNKKIQTCLKNYGVENPSYSFEIKKKIKQTLLENHGVEHPSKSKKIIEKKKITFRIKFIKKLNKYLNHLNLELLDPDYINAFFIHNWKCLKCNEEYKQNWNNIQQGYLCPKCFPRGSGTSIAEKEIYNFICDLIGKNKVEHNCQYIIKNPKTKRFLELDIYIPDKKIAFEYDGLYWHSSKININPNCHLNRTNLCKDKGIQLIHIFEDEWIFKKEIVKSRIKQILNINISLERIHARKCEIKEIDPKIKNEFLDEFHIQGKDSSKIKLGAFHNNELISVMTFGKGNISKGSKSKDKVWELNRFCSNSNYRIPGIAGKLLSHFKKNYKWEQIFSYADRRWSQGNLYFQLGFELDHITRPNYWYIKGIDRIHRFGLRKTKDEPIDIPEYLLRQKEGFSRIWDCGNLKFNLENKSI